MKTKVIALDVYGTFLYSEDAENQMPPRKGFELFVERCLDNRIILVAASDADITLLKIDLEETFGNSRGLTLKIFDAFYQLNSCPKDFSNIIKDYKIKPEELFVIGDSYDKDIKGAKALGCSFFHVQEYGGIGAKQNFPEFDFSNIEIP